MTKEVAEALGWERSKIELQLRNGNPTSEIYSN
jgi:hypothetical protein